MILNALYRKIFYLCSAILKIMTKKHLIIIGFLFFLTGKYLSAQEDTIRRNIDEVVVTATRASVNRSNVPMTISVVNREEIEESSESALLPILSEYVPGMFVTQRGVTGFGSGSGAISMRGVGGSPTTELLVLIDGHPQYMGIMGHHLPDAYVASDVEKVEVIRGPASILYGSNAMGGVINIITRKQDKDGYSVNGQVMYGSYNTQKYMANGGFKKGKFSSFLSINHDQTDGHRPNSDFSITNGYIKLGYKLNEHFQMWGDASLASYKAQDPGTVMNPLIDNLADIFRGVASLTIENNHDKVSGALKFFYNFGNHKINDGYYEGDSPKDYFFRSKDHNYGITFYESFRLLPGNLITAGIDYKNFGGKAWDDYTDANPDLVLLPDTSLYELAGYVIVQQTLFDKLTVSAGIRIEKNERYGTEWVPQGGLAYRPFRHTVLKASVSKGFRSPTILEMYMFPPQNPDLLPERMINYEVSAEQGFFANRLIVGLTGYVANGSNQIMTQMVDGSPKNLNSGAFKNKGIELAVQWNILKNLNVRGNCSFLDMKKPILNSPEQQAYIMANYRLDKWTLSAGYRYIHGLYSKLQDTTPSVTENYGLVNAKISYRLSKAWDFFLKGENLADQSYETMYGYPMPGITVFGGINLRIGN